MIDISYHLTISELRSISVLLLFLTGLVKSSPQFGKASKISDNYQKQLFNGKWCAKIVLNQQPGLQLDARNILFKLKKLFLNENQSSYDYVKLYIGYFSNRCPVWEGIFTINFFLNMYIRYMGTWQYLMS